MNLLEVLLSAYFSNAKSIFREDLRFNKNKYKLVKNTTLEAIKKIQAIQGELEFYDFLQQRFEQQYKEFITPKLKKNKKYLNCNQAQTNGL